MLFVQGDPSSEGTIGLASDLTRAVATVAIVMLMRGIATRQQQAEAALQAAPAAMSDLAPELLEWESRGSYLRVGPAGHSIYVQSVGAQDASAADTLLILHGFPESSFSFSRNVDALARRFRRVVLLNLLGFGLSDKPPDASYSLFEQADLALQTWQQLGVTGGHLLGHDMGDSVATELVARQVQGLLPGWLSGGFLSFTFTDGSMVRRLAARPRSSPLKSFLIVTDVT